MPHNSVRNNGLGNPMSAVFLKQLGELLDDHSATLDLKLHPSDVSIDLSILPCSKCFGTKGRFK